MSTKILYFITGDYAQLPKEFIIYLLNFFPKNCKSPLKKGNRVRGKERMANGTDDRDKSRNSRHTMDGRTGKSGCNSTWKEDGGGVKRSSTERVDGGWSNQKICRKITTVEIGEVKLVAAYQPLWSNGREAHA